jgi:hypothetical protein
MEKRELDVLLLRPPHLSLNPTHTWALPAGTGRSMGVGGWADMEERRRERVPLPRDGRERRLGAAVRRDECGNRLLFQKPFSRRRAPLCTRAPHTPESHAHTHTHTMTTTASLPPPIPPSARVALASRADVAKLHQLLTTTSRRALRVSCYFLGGRQKAPFFLCMQMLEAYVAAPVWSLGGKLTSFLGLGATSALFNLARGHMRQILLTPLSLHPPSQASLQDAPEGERKAAEKSLQTSVVSGEDRWSSDGER